MNIPKHQIYQMWEANGTYLGVLANVTTQYTPSIQINSIGIGEITVGVAQSADTPVQPVKAITSEDGKWLTTESGLGLTTEGEKPNYAVAHSKIRNGNILRITEVSDYHPAGLVVFTGQVRKWNVNYGTDNDSKLYVMPMSMDMNGHLVKPSEAVAVSQLTDSYQFAIYGDVGGERLAYLYDFTSAGISALSSIAIKVAAQSSGSPTTVTVSLVKTGSPAQASDYATQLNNIDQASNIIQQKSLVISSTTATETEFTFLIPGSISSSNIYGVLITATGASGSGALVSVTDSNVASGTQWANTNDGTGWRIGIPPSNVYTGDIYFKFYQIPPYTNATITNFEPSNIVKQTIGSYNSEGGIVTTTSGSVSTTGITITSYTFSVKTVAEGIDILLGFAPSNFYYAVDPGTNVLTFKAFNTAADYTLFYRRDIQTLDLSASIENLQNNIYFTGGLASGSNVFKQAQDATSQTNFGVMIGRYNDPSVTDPTTAQQLAQNYLDKNNDEVYQTTVVIPDTAMDITQFSPGQTIGFAGFGTFVDTLILPVVRVDRKFDSVTLSLGALPPRQATVVSNIQTQVSALTTVANPNQPS